MVCAENSGTIGPMSSALGNRWVQLEAQDASGVHASEEPLDEAGWRQRLSVQGKELDPAVEALLGAFTRLQLRHSMLSQRVRALGGALERLPVGVAVVTKESILASNSEAERLIDGVHLKRSPTGAIQGGTPALQRKIDAAIARVIGDTHSSEALRIERGEHATHVLFVGIDEPDAVLMVIGDPEKALSPDADILRIHHGFTPTEAKVAAHLVLGLTPREIATALEVGVETTRTHVKHILGKMGCHRQVDAVRRLVVGPALFI